MTALIIMACERPAPNWHSCIASAVLTGFQGPIVVSYDGHVPDVEREAYAHLSQVEIAEIDTLSQTPKIRACINAIHCFATASRYDRSVVVEDDITFSVGWIQWLNMVSHSFHEEMVDPIILGYCREPMESVPGIIAPIAIKRDATWDATLFVALSSLRARQAALALKENLKRSSPVPVDNALSEHWRSMGTTVLTTNPCLVQHLGDHSLINPQDGRRRASAWTGRA